MRLDKMLAGAGIGSRSEVKKYIKAGRVSVEDRTVKDEGLSVDEKSRICFDGKPVDVRQFRYYMLNKPAGVVSATEDNTCKTVMDLLTGCNKRDMFPVGRLDKDTLGLLIITNDGNLSHRLLAPKSHVDKVYYAEVSGKLEEKHIAMFREGFEFEDFKSMPAGLEILDVNSTDNISKALVTVNEGKFHEVKRFFLKVGMEVTLLKRISFGPVKLDESLKPGEFRELSEEELAMLMAAPDNK